MVKVTRVDNEKSVSLRFIGKKYKNGSAWGEWWQNDWFGVLEKSSGLSNLNDNGYIGLMRNSTDGFEYWIGMFFDKTVSVPDGFEFLDLDEREFAVFHLYGSEKNGEIYGSVPHGICMDILADSGIEVSEECLRFERYNCPRYTTPDKLGNVILDYAIAIKK